MEVQVRNQFNMEKRSLYYWSRQYAKGIGIGQDYRILPRVISINIVDYPIFTEGGFHTCFHLREAAEQLYEMRLKAQLDWNSAYNHAIETGREEALLNTARSALSEGLPIDIIQKITGLDIETIKKLSW